MKFNHPLIPALSVSLLLPLVGCGTDPQSTETNAQTPQQSLATTQARAARRLDTFINPQQLDDLLLRHPDGRGLIIVDSRVTTDYVRGHIPGAINLPPDSLRTGNANPGEGFSQYLFRIGNDMANGRLDVERYARIFGEAGIRPGDTVVVYGNFAGKADGSMAAMILGMIGHPGEVRFLDGVGLERWIATGHPVSKKIEVREAVAYTPAPTAASLWNLTDVAAHLGDPDVIFYDTRSVDEFTGKDLRKNRRGGHIPGAVNLDYSRLLDGDKAVLDAEAIAGLHRDLGIMADTSKTIVLHCQTSTRVSLPYLALRELGYTNLAIYDASMHEYLQSDLPVETE